MVANGNTTSFEKLVPLPSRKKDNPLVSFLVQEATLLRLPLLKSAPPKIRFAPFA